MKNIVAKMIAVGSGIVVILLGFISLSTHARAANMLQYNAIVNGYVAEHDNRLSYTQALSDWCPNLTCAGSGNCNVPGPGHYCVTDGQCIPFTCEGS